MHSSLSSSRPLSLQLSGLPSVPGVYIYKDTAGRIIYVGKSKNLKARVNSYFQNSHLGPKTHELVNKIASLEIIEVNSETEALLLESRLIKKFKPFYNIISKDDKSPYYIHITKEEYPRPLINHQLTGSIAGPFLNSLIPRQILKSFRRVSPFCIAPRPVKKPCFYSHLGLCDPCPSTNQRLKYQQNISRLKRLLKGNFSSVKTSLVSDMNHASKKLDFETAAKLRNQISAFEHLLSQPVLPEEYIANPNLVSDQRQSTLDCLWNVLTPYLHNLKSLARIEMYDIAHLSGTSATGAMVVAVNGELNSDHYRHFTIKNLKSNSDVDSMKEVLARRLKRKDWPLPDLLVLDGGAPQLSIISPITSLPLLSLAKRDETLVVLQDGKFVEINLDKSDPGLQLIQRLRDEAHRFSRRLHHKHRSQSLLQ